jgi:hypothetical protein
MISLDISQFKNVRYVQFRLSFLSSINLDERGGAELLNKSGEFLVS